MSGVTAYAEAHSHPINDRHVALWVAGGKKEHHAKRERQTSHLLHRREKQGGDFRVGRMQEHAYDEGLTAEDEEYARDREQ
jgi:hypothetical protein